MGHFGVRTALNALALALALGGGAPAAVAAAPAPGQRTASAPASAGRAVKIVFVGKQYPCECTAKTIAATRGALDRALGPRPKLALEELMIDRDADKVDALRRERPLRALPALYFVDAAGKVLDVLDGDLSEAQITAALRK